MKKWIGEDDTVLGIIGNSELIGKCVSILGSRTTEDIGSSGRVNSPASSVSSSSSFQILDRNRGMKGNEGVSVSEKNGMLGILLEVVEGGGWRGKYSELEAVVSQLEEEGEKEWRDRKGKRGGGNEWREMGRLAHAVAWGIEKRKKMEEGGETESGIISVGRMKKEMEKSVEEEKRRVEEEKRKMKEEYELRAKESEKKVAE